MVCELRNVPTLSHSSPSCIDAPPCPALSALDFQVSGRVSYNGHSLSEGEFLPQRTSSFVPQSDTHIGELTVRDTLDFAACLNGPAFPPGG